jgi:hypothetical protein
MLDHWSRQWWSSFKQYKENYSKVHIWTSSRLRRKPKVSLSWKSPLSTKLPLTQPLWLLFASLHGASLFFNQREILLFSHWAFQRSYPLCVLCQWLSTMFGQYELLSVLCNQHRMPFCQASPWKIRRASAPLSLSILWHLRHLREHSFSYRAFYQSLRWG